MIKRTIFLQSRSMVRLKRKQLEVVLTETNCVQTVPIEDIGIVLLEHPAITITHQALASLVDSKVAVITCNASYMPAGLLLPLEGHSTQTQRFFKQIEARKPMYKRLWQQTIRKKIENQASVLRRYGLPWNKLQRMARNVKSGDPDNVEAQAAALYWVHLFSDFDDDFSRDPEGEGPNIMLNYGYAVLRACVARALIGSGLLPFFGIHHRNKYNPFCLADDVMEPYRPFVDMAVRRYIDKTCECPKELATEEKRWLIETLQYDVKIDGQLRPLCIALQITTASLAKCFEGSAQRISYPSVPHET